MPGLRWIESKKHELAQALRRPKRHVRHGCNCVFVKLSKTVGAKIYMNQNDRDRALEKQRHAASYRLAPQTGDKFQIDCFQIDHHDHIEPEVGYRVVYGYLTQVVQVRRSVDWDDLHDLRWALSQIGITHYDLWEENVGYVGERMVCIDFDHNSCQWARGRKRQGCKETPKIGF